MAAKLFSHMLCGGDQIEASRLHSPLFKGPEFNRARIKAPVDGLVIVDETMTIAGVNEFMCQMLGRPRSELVGSSFPNYFTDRDRAAEGIRLSFKEGAITNYVLTLQTMAGKQVLVCVNAAIFKDSTGIVRGIIVSVRDITEQ